MENRNHCFKRILACLMVVVMTLSAVPMSGFVGLELPKWSEMFVTRVSAASYSGKCGANAVWLLDTSTGVLEISGSGNMQDYDDYYDDYRGDCYAPWYNCKNYIRSINIGSSVTSIGEDAFCDCTGLKSVTIGKGVTSIGKNAFYKCTALTSVSVPDSVTSIGSGAFADTAWYNAQPDGDVYAGKVYYAYKGKMPENTRIRIKDGTKGIADYAFYSTCLTSITIPEGVTSIGDYAFFYCSGLTSITIPDSVTSIGSSAFCFCSGLTSITIPDSVTSIGDYAFFYCSGLKSITIPDSVTSIGGSAFYNTAWYSAQPSGDVYVGKFYYEYKGSMPENTSVVVKDGTKGIADSAFSGCTGLTSITIPDSATSIGNYAFENCTGLTSLTIGNSVTSIGNQAFYNCTGLTEIQWNAENVGDFASDNKVFAYAGTADRGIDLVFGDNVRHIPAYAFYSSASFEKCKLMYVTFGNGLESIGSSAFYGCVGRISNIPDSVVHVGSDAFKDTKWYEYQANGSVYFGKVLYTYKGAIPQNTKLEVADGTKSITDSAFSNNSNLVEISLPSSVITIEDNTFSNCEKLQRVNLPQGLVSIGAAAFSGCTELQNITIPDSVTEIGSEAFNDCSKITSVNIPSGVTKINTGTFKSCSSLNTVTIPNSVTEIGENAFYECRYLKKITIPGSVQTIGNSAFRNCTSLKSVIIPESVKTIGNYAFRNCKTLSYVEIVNGVKSIGKYAFQYTAIKNIIIPDSVTTIGAYAFANCSALKSVILGNGITTVPSYSFLSSPNISTIKIGKNVTSIGEDAISDITSLPEVYYAGSVSDWKNIAIDQSNDKLIWGNIHYNADISHTHTYTGVIIRPSSCIETGIKTFTCECGKQYTENLLLTAHTPVADAAVAPTCTKTGLTEGSHCSVCGTVLVAQQTVAKKAHTPAPAVKEFEIDATCQSGGSYESVVYCSVCNTEISRKAVDIDKLKHTVVIDKAIAPTCSKYGKTEGSHCSACGMVFVAQKTVAKKAHALKTTVTKATTSKDGKVVSACTVCKGVAKTVVIPMASYMKLSATSYVYDGKEKVPSVTVKDSKGKILKNGTDYTVKYASGRKYVGTYAVAVTLKGNYSGSKTLSYYIVPKGTAIRSVSARSAGFTVEWTKQTTQTTGYQIQYSQSSSFKSAKAVTVKKNTATAQAVVNLKSNAKYYVRIRTYKIVGDKNYYSSWSAAKAVTTKPAIEVRIPTSAMLYVGGAKTLSVKTYPTNVTVKWKSSNTSVAKVSSAGKVTAVKKGSAVITAYFTYGGKTYKCNCTVTVKNPSLLLSKTSVSVAQNASVTIKATAAPSNVTVRWKSSNTSVVRVSSSGKITGVKKGTATVTAYFTYAGKTYSRTCKVSVVQDYKKDYVNIAARALILIQGQVMNPSSLKINNIFYRKDDRVIIWYSAANSFGGMIDYYACAYFNAEDSGIYRMDNCYQIKTPGGYVEVLMNYPGLSEYVGTVDVNEVLEKVEEIHQITFRG